MDHILASILVGSRYVREIHLRQGPKHRCTKVGYL